MIMNQFKRTKVIMLPTENAKSDYYQLWLSKRNVLYSATAVKGVKSHEDTKFQELYIISDDEIKEGDWYYNSLYREVYQCNNQEKYRTEIHVNNILEKLRHNKIIATTDTSLKRAVPQEQLGEKFNDYYPLPEPSQQFIEKYIESYNKGEVITDVLVEYEIDKVTMACTCTDNITSTNCVNSYIDSDYHESCRKRFPNGEYWDKTFKPKVNPKDNTITIKKLKDNWNREEVIKLLEDYSVFDDGTVTTRNKFIEKYL